MRDLGVTDQQFVDACEKAALNPIHKKIVDQIMAVDNFLAFKRLMVKRNNELNQQVLAIDKQLPSQPAPVKPGQPQPSPAVASDAMKEALRVAQELEQQEEEEMIRRAIAESQKLEEQKKHELDQEEEMIRQVIEMSRREEEERLNKIEVQEKQQLKTAELASIAVAAKVNKVQEPEPPKVVAATEKQK